MGAWSWLRKRAAANFSRYRLVTFGEIAALGLKASIYCSGLYEHCRIDPIAEHLRDRYFARARFRRTKLRYTGAVCGCLGSVAIEPSVLLPVGGEETLAFLYCGTCLPSWEINHVPIDKPPWSRLNRKSNDRFRCPGCGKAVAWRIHGPSWRPSNSPIMSRDRGSTMAVGVNRLQKREMKSPPEHDFGWA
jgi:hypothetical protein